jgi:hypothetical protein
MRYTVVYTSCIRVVAGVEAGLGKNPLKAPKLSNGIVIVQNGLTTVGPNGRMSGIGIRIAGVVVFGLDELVVRVPGVYVTDRVPDFCVNTGTKPERERLEVIHHGVEVGVGRVEVGGVVMGPVGDGDEPEETVETGGVLEGFVDVGEVVEGKGLVIAVTVLLEVGVTDAGTTVTTIEVESVSVVLKPSVAIVIVVVIGTVDNETVGVVGLDGAGVVTTEVVGEVVTETDVDEFVGDTAVEEFELTG